MRVEDNFLITRRRGGEALELPGRDRAGMIDRSKIWTGSAQREGARPAVRTGVVGLYDTTLRDGEQSVGVVLSPEDKLEIAQALDAAGIDRIEAGFPRVSADDWRAVELVSGAGLDAEVWGFSRAVQADVEALVELGVPASRDREPDLGRQARGARRLAREDAGADPRAPSRSPPAPGSRSRSSASTRRAPISSSTAAPTRRRSRRARRRSSSSTRSAIATPEAAAYLVGQTVDWLGGEIPVHWHGHDDFGLGTAAAIAAVQAGATWVQGTINGMGERAGNADLIEVALALEALYGIPTRLDLTQARALSQLVQERAGHAAAVVEGGHRRRALHARVGRGGGAVPRPAGDRAVQLGARRRDARHRARQEERHRLDPDRRRAARAGRARGAAGRPSRGREAARRRASGGLVTRRGVHRARRRAERRSGSAAVC